MIKYFKELLDVLKSIDSRLKESNELARKTLRKDEEGSVYTATEEYRRKGKM